MKTIGLIGGMSSESAALYYRLINKEVNRFLGEHHTAEIVMVSLNFHDIVQAMHTNAWQRVTDLLIEAAKKLEACSVDIIAICCNSAHKVFSSVQQNIKTPVLHILEPICEHIQKMQLKTVALLGNRFTMEDDFYVDYLRKKTRANAIIPDDFERAWIHNIIYSQLCHGIIDLRSKKKLVKIINGLKESQNAQAVILGCTELPLLISYSDVKMPILNTTKLHAVSLSHFAITERESKLQVKLYEN